jgi:hypothetical protein
MSLDDEAKLAEQRRRAAKASARMLEFVQEVQRSDLKAASIEKGRIVIGSGDGHVVIVRPGTDRVLDGNTLSGFKDLLAGNEITHPKVIKAMNDFINEGRKNADLDIGKADRNLIREYINRYEKEGARIEHSWPAPDLQEHKDTTKNIVRWFQVPRTTSLKEMIDIVESYKPPKAPDYLPLGGRPDWYQHNRCSDFVQKVVPFVVPLVKEEVKPVDGIAPYANANNIDKALKARADETNKALPLSSPEGGKTSVPVSGADDSKKTVPPPPPPGSAGKPAVGGVKMPLDLDPNGVRRETGTTDPKKQILKDPPLPVRDR